MDVAVQLMQRFPDLRPLLFSGQTVKKRSPTLREFLYLRAGEIPVDPAEDAPVLALFQLLRPFLQPPEQSFALLSDSVGRRRRSAFQRCRHGQRETVPMGAAGGYDSARHAELDIGRQRLLAVQAGLPPGDGCVVPLPVFLGRVARIPLELRLDLEVLALADLARRRDPQVRPRPLPRNSEGELVDFGLGDVPREIRCLKNRLHVLPQRGAMHGGQRVNALRDGAGKDEHIVSQRRSRGGALTLRRGRSGLDDRRVPWQRIVGGCGVPRLRFDFRNQRLCRQSEFREFVARNSPDYRRRDHFVIMGQNVAKVDAALQVGNPCRNLGIACLEAVDGGSQIDEGHAHGKLGPPVAKKLVPVESAEQLRNFLGCVNDVLKRCQRITWRSHRPSPASCRYAPAAACS